MPARSRARIGAFLDEVEVVIRSGSGGSGCLSFRREKFLPRGGPDGGDGGHGGGFYAVARSALNTFEHLGGRRIFAASRGQPGGSRKMHGRNGEDLFLELPVGSLIKDAERGNVLAELVTPDEPVLLLRGGSGGRGSLAWSPVCRALFQCFCGRVLR